MSGIIRSFLRDESGGSAVEYGLIAAFIAVMIVAALTSLGTKLNGTFTRVKNGLG